jgi:hypothetical protein
LDTVLMTFGGGGAGFISGGVVASVATTPAGALAGMAAGATLGAAAGMAIGNLVANLMESGGSGNCEKDEGLRRKAGKRGQFKSSDALRRENNMARDAAKEVGLDKKQADILHKEITGQDLKYNDIVGIAKDIKNGIF